MDQFTPLQYLYIDIANQYGLDRKSWQTRINWTQRNLGELLNYTDTAENKFGFIKSVQALRDTQNGIATGHLMSLDATAQGFQLLALLSGCRQSASMVNLINTGKREDLYTNIADAMNEMPNVNITRDQAKKPIMTTGYGSRAAPTKLFGDGPELLAYWEMMYKKLPGAMWLADIIQNSWDPSTTCHAWTMPNGFEVKANVYIPVDKKIEIDELGHVTFTHRAYVVGKEDKGMSLTANICHATDAYIADEMVIRAKKQNFELLTIFDCFYASPNFMQLVRQNYVDILVEISKTNLISSILSDIRGQTVQINKLGDITEAISQAEYALS